MNSRRILAVSAILVSVLAASLPLLAGDVTPPQARLKTQIQPYYPATAMMNPSPATVTLLAQVRADGKIGDLEVVGCSRPNAGFEESALDAVKYWKFKPALQDGKAVDYYTQVTLTYQTPVGSTLGGEALARTTVRPIGTSPLPESVAIPGVGANQTAAAGGNSTAATGQDAPYAVAPNFPKGELGKLIDRRGFSPIQRGVTPLPGAVGRSGSGSGAGRGASAPTRQGRR